MEEYFGKLFSLMDSLWMEISSKHNGFCLYMMARGHLDKVEKDQQRIKTKLSTLSDKSNLKKMVFEKFNEHLHF